jgi:hypothetical protein
MDDVDRRRSRRQALEVDMSRNWFRSLLSVALLATSMAAAPTAEAGTIIQVRTSHNGPAFLPQRPSLPPVLIRPARPSYTHVWVEGFWDWNGYQWQWMPGYWQTQVVAQPSVVVRQVAVPYRQVNVYSPAVYRPVVARPVQRVSTSHGHGHAHGHAHRR